jgi:trigger factor
MNIVFENPDKINGLMTITVEETDYKDAVEKELKNYRKKANVPGFRPGMVPMGMIKRMYGTSVKLDVVNRVVGEQMYKYINDNKIQMLGQPLPSDKQKPQDLDKDTTLNFVFDVAVAPEFEVKLSGHDKVPYYNIKIDDELINRQVDMFASRSGSYVDADEFSENDILKGDLRELDDKGNTLEGGVTVSDASVMPDYLKEEEHKKLFKGVKKGDVLTINPSKMYSDTELATVLKLDKSEAVKHTGDFSYQITSISRFQKAAVDQKLFDSVFGQGVCADEAAFRAKIAEGLKAQLQSDTDYKFLLDVRAHIEKKIGKLEYPDALLKRIMLEGNKEKGDDFVEKNYEESIKQLTWHLIKEQLVEAHKIKIEDADIKATAKEAARVQFAQYGMNNVPDEYLENYANEMIKNRESTDGLVDRAIDVKLTQILKGVVKLDEKEISLDEFNKLMEAK